MRLVLHVGYPKTGTTALQYGIFKKHNKINYISREHLKKENIKDPLLYRENSLSSLSKTEEYRKILLKSFSEDKLNIISEELLLASSLSFTRYPYPFVFCRDAVAMSFVLSKILEGCDVTILITIRKQKSFLKSYYAEAQPKLSKFGLFNRFGKWTNYLIQHAESYILPNLDYYESVQLYKNTFGEENVKVLVFEELKENPRSYLNRLSEILGLDLSDYEEDIQKKCNVRKKKKGYEVKGSSLKSIIYYRKIKYFGNKPWNLPGWSESLLKTKIPFTSKTLKLEYTKEQERHLFNIFKESNKKLDEKFNLGLKEYGYY